MTSKNGVDFERVTARRIKAGGTELVGQPNDTQTAPVALFGVLAFAHYNLCEGGDIRPDTSGPCDDTLWRPVLAELVVRWHVLALFRMSAVSRSAHMGSNTLSNMEDFDRAGGDAGPQLFLQQLIGHGIVMLVDCDVVIEPRSALLPFGIDIGGFCRKVCTSTD
ncbi:hypothetical protein DSM109990_03945 (plasmid) [Sulfitobacter dubius]|uniref:Nucleotide-diphospho-sugar transferase domain-containing protein n=1 Tax=Sulfitobacter dubius TaxID=218673 RepID=A0ABY3ZTV2_9RHOB|nr:hypothetical protein DSM109990_03945 [Sulfitobacter dubius]